MTAQSLFKHLLTEGDKFIVSWLSPLKDQGGYAIAVNYGSLVARIVFQPMEEILRVYYSKTLAVNRIGTSNSSKSNTTITPSHEALQRASEALVSVIAIQSSLTIVLLTFAPPYLQILLQLMLPPKYLSTSAPSVFSAWIWYIPVLAINGGLEAFVSSVATPADLNKQSKWMAAFSATYVCATIGLYALGFGDTSLVYANIINLSIRIVYCCLFVGSYFEARSASNLLLWKRVIPSGALIISLMASNLLINYDARRQEISSAIDSEGRQALLSAPVAIHVGIGGVLGVACMVTWWVSAGRFLVPSRRRKTQ